MVTSHDGYRFIALMVLAASVWAAEPPSHDERGFTPGESLLRAQLRPVHHTVVASAMSGHIAQFVPRVGDRVIEAETVVTYHCEIQHAGLDISRSRLEAARTRLMVNQRLLELNNGSQLDVSLAQADVSIAEAELKKAEHLATGCILVAPFSGTVTEKYVQAHQYINEGEPLFRLVDTLRLEVEMVVPSSYLKDYDVGTSFHMKVDETGDYVEAIIDRIVGVVDPVSQTVRMIGQIKSPPENLLPGMSGSLTFASGSEESD